jgi:hypothetical protein
MIWKGAARGGEIPTTFWVGDVSVKTSCMLRFVREDDEKIGFEVVKWSAPVWRLGPVAVLCDTAAELPCCRNARIFLNSWVMLSTAQQVSWGVKYAFCCPYRNIFSMSSYWVFHPYAVTMSTVFIVNVSRFKNFALHKFTVTAGADRTPEWGGGGRWVWRVRIVLDRCGKWWF